MKLTPASILRPFKDPNFDLRKAEQDQAVQAVAETTSIAIQVCVTDSQGGMRRCEGQVQCYGVHL